MAPSNCPKGICGGLVYFQEYKLLDARYVRALQLAAKSIYHMNSLHCSTFDTNLLSQSGGITFGIGVSLTLAGVYVASLRDAVGMCAQNFLLC